MFDLNLSFDILKSELEEYVVCANILENSEQNISLVRVYDQDVPVLETACAYVCTPETYPDEKKLFEGVGIICCGNPNCNMEECEANYNLLVLEGLSLNQALNKLVELFVQYKKFNSDINAMVLMHSSIADITEKIAGFIKLPLCLIDINQEVVAISRHVTPDSDILWSSMYTDDAKTRRNILKYQIDTILTAPDRHKEWITKEFSVFETPILVSTLMIDGHSTAFLWGFLPTNSPTHSSAHSKNGFTKAERQLFEWASHIFVSWMKKSEQVQAGRGNANERFLLDLVNQRHESRSQIMIAAQEIDFPLDVSGECQLLTIVSSKTNSLNFSRQLKVLEQLEEALSEAVCAIYERAFLVLLKPQNFGYLSQMVEKKLAGLCTIHGCFALIGNIYDHVEDTSKVFAQLMSTFTFIDTSSNKYGLYHYFDFAPNQENLLLANHQPLETSYHPMIRAIEAYDEEHGSDYLHTLKVYLNNMCNISEAAAELGMHRNSLIYRVDKIEKILGSDFKPWRLRRLLLRSMDNLYFNRLLKENPFSIKI